jgi:hypothetical protein
MPQQSKRIDAGIRASKKTFFAVPVSRRDFKASALSLSWIKASLRCNKSITFIVEIGST